MQTAFKTTVLGLNAKQVDETIARIKREHEEILAEKDERFIDLRDRLSVLQEQLERFQRQERSISNAVIDAHNKAAEIIQNAQKAAEEERSRARLHAQELIDQAKEEVEEMRAQKLELICDMEKIASGAEEVARKARLQTLPESLQN